MMDNTKDRLLDVFFYGLYMDPELLRAKQVEPREPRISFVEGYRLRIGNMATLLRSDDSRASGIVYAITHDEIDLLYAKSGLDMYVAEAVLVRTETGGCFPAMTCNLLIPPEEHESNPEYLKKLIMCMQRLGVPREGL